MVGPTAFLPSVWERLQMKMPQDGVPAGWGAALGLALFIATVFWPMPYFGWVDFDDTLHVTENPGFLPLTWSSLLRFWLAPYENLYIPVSYSLYALEAWIDRAIRGQGPAAPLMPGVFHLTSLVLHGCVVMLVYRMLRIAHGPTWSVVAGTALFAVHPLQAESVCWISEQRGLLAALFSLLAMNGVMCLGHATSSRSFGLRYSLATCCFGLALLAKPSAVIVPLLALVVTQGTSVERRGMKAGWLLPWFCLSALSALATVSVQPHGLPDSAVTAWARLLVSGDALAFYVRKVIWPVGLSVAYGRTPQAVLADPRAPFVAIAMWTAIVAVFGAAALRPARRSMLLFVVPLLPVLGFTPFLFQNQSIVADRYAYLAMIGPAWAVACQGDARSWETSRTGRPTEPKFFYISVWFLQMATVVMLALLALRSHAQVQVWRDTGSLARQAAAVNPQSIAAWTLLAAYELDYGNPVTAIDAAHRALSIEPRNHVALTNCAAAGARSDQQRDAEAALERLEQLGYSRQDVARTFFSRGCLHLTANRNRQASQDFRFSLQLDASQEWVAINLGVALTRLGDTKEAIDVFRQCLSGQPQRVEGWVGLGNALYATKSYAEAEAAYAKALAIDPSDSAVLLNRANARERLGDIIGAAEDVAAAERVLQSSARH